MATVTYHETKIIYNTSEELTLVLGIKTGARNSCKQSSLYHGLIIIYLSRLITY